MTGVSPDLVDALYTAHPDSFVPARDEAVASARAAGDAAAAREIAKLRKPTIAAWLVNLLAIRRPDLVAELVELSAALRSAQRELRGPQLRELSAQRRGVVSALVAQAQDLATDANAGVSAGKLPLSEVEATLNAALSDVDVADQVRSGRLVRAATYAGFGEVPRPQLRLVTGGVATPPARAPGEPAGAEVTAAEAEAAGTKAGGTEAAGTKGTKAAADRERKAEEAARASHRRELARELAAARTQQKRAEAELTAAAAAERDGASALAEVEAALADLERRRAAAEQEIGRRKLARRAAERAAAAARRRSGEVEAAVEAFDAERGGAQKRVRKADSSD